MNCYAGKRVLITGGLGFIGSNLGRALLRLGATVTLVDSLIPQYGGSLFNIHDLKGQLTVNICDIRDQYAMEFLVSNQDYIFNLAGQTSHMDSMENPKIDLEINAAAQLSVLECCRKVNKKVKIIFASTRQIYGRPDYLPVDELHSIRPIDVNGINKSAGESFHLLYNKVYGIRSCALRLTNTYGPCMRVKDARQTFLGIWVRNLLENRPITIFGDGLQLRDFNFVDDCVEAMLLAGLSDAANGKVYNLGSDEIINLKNLAEKMVRIHGHGTVEYIPFPPDRKLIDIGDYYGRYDLFSNELGWKPRVSLDDGIKKTLSYYSKHAKEYWP